MAERRSFARKKRRFLVEFQFQGAQCNGFTYDVSPTGIFVRSIRMPVPGTYLTANLHLPEGKRIAVRGRVVRSFRVAAGAVAPDPERLFDASLRHSRGLLPAPVEPLEAQSPPYTSRTRSRTLGAPASREIRSIASPAPSSPSSSTRR